MVEKEFGMREDNIRKLASGAKRDNNRGKGAYELISPFALERLALVYERGIKKKGARSWEKGVSFGRCIQSAKRHIDQYMIGMENEDHLMQACFNLFAIAHYEECIKLGLLPKELDNLPRYLQKVKSIKKKK